MVMPSWQACRLPGARELGAAKRCVCSDQGREGGCADGVTTRPEGRMAMQGKTRVKAGGVTLNHNETLVRAKGQAPGLTVKTRVKAGGGNVQHNETLVRATPRQRARV